MFVKKSRRLVVAFAYRIHPCIRRTFLSQNSTPKLGVRLIHGYEIIIISIQPDTKANQGKIDGASCTWMRLYTGEYGNVILLVFRAGSITNTARSLDLLRQNLQKHMDKEIDAVIQKYLDVSACLLSLVHERLAETR